MAKNLDYHKRAQRKATNIFTSRTRFIHVETHNRQQFIYVQLCCPSTEELVFKDGCGDVSFGSMLLPAGGIHLFEKKAAILLVRRELFSSNDKIIHAVSEKNNVI